MAGTVRDFRLSTTFSAKQADTRAFFFIIIIISVWRQHEIDVVSKIGASPAQFVYGFLEHFVASGNGP